MKLFVSPNTIFSWWRGTRGRAERDKNNKGVRHKSAVMLPLFVLPCWFVANSPARLFRFIRRRRTAGCLESAGGVAAVRKRPQTPCFRTDGGKQEEGSGGWRLCGHRPPAVLDGHAPIRRRFRFARVSSQLKPDPSLFLTLLLQQQSASFPFPGISKAAIPHPPMIFRVRVLHNGGSTS